ncbi:MAG: DnaB-like helicase C-terminal domain-containing protein, partial [Alphaproteobacteria bacterium]
HLLGVVAKSFANLGRQTDSAVILLSQLSRRVDTAQEKRPSLADLRDSGELEADADVVAFLYRPGYYDPKSDQTKAELILAKNRHGRQGIEPLHWDAERVRFLSVDERRGTE